MKIRNGIAAFLSLVAQLTPVFAQNDDHAVADAADLRHAQKLLIRFHGVPELTGDYRVSAEGVISVPVIGRVNVAGVRTQQLESVLMKRGREVASRETFVAVEIVSYKPVFVTGYVSAPGSAEWRPGMTVFHAVALSGGIFRPPSDARGATGLSEASSSQVTQLRRALDNQMRTLVTIAMLRAEDEGKQQIEAPEQLIELVGRTEAETLIRDQAPILAARREGLKAKLDTVRRADAATRAELNGLEQQRDKIDEQLRLRRTSRDKLDELLKKGLVRSDRTLEEAIRVSELEEKLVNIGVAISRVQGTRASLERDALALGQERRVPLKEEIQLMERQLAQHKIEVEGSIGPHTPIHKRDAGPGTSSLEIEFGILRRQNGNTTMINAEADTMLWPDDVLSVMPRLRSGR